LVVATDDTQRRAAYVPFVFGGGALAVGLGLAAWSTVATDAGEVSTTTAPGSASTPTAVSTSAGGSAAATDSGGGSAADAEDAPYAPDLDGADIGEALSSEGASAHGMAVVGERLVWIETEGARVASAPLTGGAATTLSSVDDEDRYGGGFAAATDGVFWSVGDVGGAPDPIYFVTGDELALDKPALTPQATAASVDELAVAGGDLYVADGGRLVKLDGEEQTLIATRPGRLVAMVGCGSAPWWLEAPLSGRGEHALMTLDSASGEVVRRARLAEAERGPMGCWAGAVVWAEDRADGTHRLARLSGSGGALVAATGTVTAIAVDGDDLYWAEVHGERDEAVSLIRRRRGAGATERIGRDAGTITALAVAGGRLFWASDDGVMTHPSP
jgi:hypothetical protein